ncbi:MAG: VOC family protein [Vicinamibacterales bacterium]
MGAPVLQWQLVATKPDELVKFYKELFGWTISATNAIGYRQVAAGEGGISGGIWPAPPDAHSFAQLFIGVPDVQASATQATNLGARVIVPPTTLPDGDTMAVLQDPCGVTFGLMTHANKS